MPTLVAEEVLKEISQIPEYNTKTIRRIRDLIEETYPSFEEGVFDIAKFIEQTGVQKTYAQGIRRFMSGKVTFGSLKAINAIYRWATQYYPIYRIFNEKGGEIQGIILRTSECLNKILEEKWGITKFPKIVFRKSFRTYHRKSEIIIGYYGLCVDIKEGALWEYPTVAPEIFRRCEKEAGVCKVKLSPNDWHLIPAIVLAHEYAHYVSEVKHGTRWTNTGRRQVHDRIFIDIYKKLLEALAEECYPSLKKYLR